MMTRVIILIITLCVVAFCCSSSFVNCGEVDDVEQLKSVVFETKGEPKPPEELLITLKALNQVWKSPRSLVDTLVKIAEVADCNTAQYYLRFANTILNDYKSHININNFVKYYRLILVKKCVQDWTRAYIGSYYEIDAYLRGASVVLKEEVRLAKDDGLFSYGKQQFYPKNALIKGVYNFLRTRSGETALRIDKKKEVHRKDFDKLYDDSVNKLCQTLLTEEVARHFVNKSKFFLDQVNVDETLINLFKSDVKDFMSRVYICLDIHGDVNLSSDVYNLVKERKRDEKKKGFRLEKCLWCSK